MSKKKSEQVENVDFSQGAGELTVDFGNVEEASFELLPKGNYPVVITEAEFNYSSKGNPMWSLKLEVNGGEYAGRKLFTHVVFSEAALPFAKRTISNIAPDLLSKAFKADDQGVLDTIAGIECTARVGVQRYQDEDRNNVKDLLAPETGGFQA